MNTLITLAAFAVFAFGIYFNYNRDSDNLLDQESEVLSQESVEEKITPSISAIIQEDEQIKEPMVYPSPASAVEFSLGIFKYPDSEIQSESLTSIKLESSDDADKITNWYKGMIKSLGMNVTSFVTTKTNGDVLNKLAAIGGQKNVSIVIEKESSEIKTLITVSVE